MAWGVNEIDKKPIAIPLLRYVRQVLLRQLVVQRDGPIAEVGVEV